MECSTVQAGVPFQFGGGMTDRETQIAAKAVVDLADVALFAAGVGGDSEQRSRDWESVVFGVGGSLEKLARAGEYDGAAWLLQALSAIAAKTRIDGRGGVAVDDEPVIQ